MEAHMYVLWNLVCVLFVLSLNWLQQGMNCSWFQLFNLHTTSEYVCILICHAYLLCRRCSHQGLCCCWVRRHVQQLLLFSIWDMAMAESVFLPDIQQIERYHVDDFVKCLTHVVTWLWFAGLVGWHTWCKWRSNGALEAALRYSPLEHGKTL